MSRERLPLKVKPPARFVFPVDERLISRQLEAARAHPIQNIKRLINAEPSRLTTTVTPGAERAPA